MGCSRQVGGGLTKAGRALVEPATHLPHAFADGGFRLVEPGIRAGTTAQLRIVPPSAPQLQPTIDGQNAVSLPPFIALRFAARVGRRGEKRLPPHPPSTARPFHRPPV